MAASRILGLIIGADIAASIAAAAFAQSPILKERAEKGDARSQFEYAMQLYQAGGTAREEARAWNQKAADAGEPGAIYWLGYAGWGKEKPVYYYKKAADLGYPEAFRTLMGALINAGDETDVVAAKKYADLAIAKNIALDKYLREFLAVIDACYRAGPANMPSLHAPHSVDMPEYHRIEQYANGRDVARDPKKALALVCQDRFMAQAEMKDITPLLEAAIAAPLAKEFIFCNYVTSGVHQNLCSGEGEAGRREQWISDLAKLTVSWTPEQKSSLVTLRAAAEAFFDARTYGETDHRGSAHVAMSLYQTGRARQALLDSLKDFEAARFPPHDDFAKADRELNDTYRALLARKEWDQGPPVSPSPQGIRAAERAWLSFRDAWAALGAARYPQVPANDWKAWATRARIKDLADIAKYLE
ncbi:MAG TPA: lysozyme inhibitor LprI family protein [Hyphomonadaceae bacterium]|jgi:hypothetical protein|nr:lysozyme inhibitor LprI family protein [Hyphomonadaceae bacterium]